MFFRATYKAEGTGIGLYIVKEALEKMNGQIQCFSEPGIGTTFEVIMPYNECVRGKVNSIVENV